MASKAFFRPSFTPLGFVVLSITFTSSETNLLTGSSISSVPFKPSSVTHLLTVLVCVVNVIAKMLFNTDKPSLVINFFLRASSKPNLLPFLSINKPVLVSRRPIDTASKASSSFPEDFTPIFFLIISFTSVLIKPCSWASSKLIYSLSNLKLPLSKLPLSIRTLRLLKSSPILRRPISNTEFIVTVDRNPASEAALKSKSPSDDL
uniref:Putative secreted protein n=1 Tax=Panstrongylus lignarius TaxID=156445 RepID=A0A224XT49_9HEMI